MNILLTCFYFDGFSGSPIHCMEMGEHLAQKHSVSIAAVKTNQEMIDLCRSKSINLYNLEELPLIPYMILLLLITSLLRPT